MQERSQLLISVQFSRHPIERLYNIVFRIQYQPFVLMSRSVSVIFISHRAADGLRGLEVKLIIGLALAVLRRRKARARSRTCRRRSCSHRRRRLQWCLVVNSCKVVV